MSDSITVNLDNYKKLRVLYKDAVKAGMPVVEFEGAQLVVSYLYYLLEYMETRSLEIASYCKRKKIGRIKHAED